MKPTAQHTPGPWEIARFNPSPRHEAPYYKIDSAKEGIAHVHGSEADARLIAAAPALLAALKLALKCADDHGADHYGFGEFANEAQEAISLAEQI